jgi:hypothetical protein
MTSIETNTMGSIEVKKVVRKLRLAPKMNERVIEEMIETVNGGKENGFYNQWCGKVEMIVNPTIDTIKVGDKLGYIYDGYTDKKVNQYDVLKVTKKTISIKECEGAENRRVLTIKADDMGALLPHKEISSKLSKILYIERD